MKVKIFIFICALFIFGERNGFSGEETGIHGLRWKSGPIAVVRELRLGTYQIIVSGYFSRSGWKLYLGNYEVPLKEDGEFNLPIPVSINHIKAEFFSKNSRGSTENEVIYISLGDYFNTQDPRNKKIGRTQQWFEKQLRDMSLNLGVGTTLLAYDQTSLPTVSQTGLTPKVDFTYVFADNEWSLESSAYCSLFSSLKLFGTDLKMGYELPLIEGRMAFYLFGGLYYATTFGSETLGYSGVWGPVVYPALRTTFRNGSSLAVYGKYSPILTDYLPMSLDNASASLGVTYYFRPFSGNRLKGVPLGVSLDATRLKLGLEGGSLIVTTYTLSGNLMF